MIRSRLCLNHVFITYFVVFVILLTIQQLAQLAHHWFTLNWTTVILYTTTSLLINSIASSRSRTVWYVQSVGPPSFLISHLHCGLRSLHWLKVRERIEYKVLSLTYNSLQYHQPSCLSDLLTVQSNTFNSR